MGRPKNNKKMYSFRKITGRDLFKLAKFFKKIDINEIKRLFDDVNNIRCFFANNYDNAEHRIMDGGKLVLSIVDIVLENMAKLEDDVFEVLAEFSDLSIEEINELDLEIFEEMLIDFIQMPQILDFIKRTLQRLGLQLIAPQTKK